MLAKSALMGTLTPFLEKETRYFEIWPEYVEYVYILCSVDCSTIHQPTASDFLSVSRGSPIILGFVCCDEDYHCHPVDALHSQFDSMIRFLRVMRWLVLYDYKMYCIVTDK